MLKAIEKYPPPAYKGKYIKIKYCTQFFPISILCVLCKFTSICQGTLQTLFRKSLRSVFNFEGVPLNLFLEK